MILVRHLIRNRIQRDLPTINPEATVLSALKQLAKLDVGALLVVRREKIIGIFSERDYAQKIALEGVQSPLTLVHSVMTRDILYVGLDNTIEECLCIMIKKRVKHLPVFSNDELVDFLSMRDVVEKLIDGKNFLISQLTQYITGSQFHHVQFSPIDLSVENHSLQMEKIAL